MRSRKIMAVIVSLSVLCGLSSCGQVTGSANKESSVPSTQGTTEEPTAAASGTTTAVTTSAVTTTAVTTTAVHDENDVESIELSFYDADMKVGESTMPMVTMLPETAPDKSEIWTSSDEKVAAVDAAGNISAIAEGECIVTVTSASTPDVKAEVKVKVSPEPGLTYMDGVLIVNKSYSLPASYNPGGLTKDTETAFAELVEGAANDGINIYLSSGFRSYDYQNEIYNNYISVYGKAATDTFSARPGNSEHQSGMAIDVNIIDDSFTGTPEAIWIEEHCTEYGFILRYPPGKQEITGYKYEPWHIRYVGRDFAKKLTEAAEKANDPYLTLEEYFDIDSVYPD